MDKNLGSTKGEVRMFQDLTIFSVAFGRYLSFVPFFCVLAGKSFPGVRVVVAVPQPVLGKVKGEMKATVLRLGSSFGSEVVFRAISLKSKEFEDQDFVIAGGALKLERWLAPRDVFGGRKFGLVTDIDMAFLPSKAEDLRLALHSIEHRKVAFYNFQRSDGLRLSGGSHMIATERYFNFVEKEIELMRESTIHRSQVFRQISSLRSANGVTPSGILRDENILWHICNATMPKKDYLASATGNTSVPFGLHLGGGKGTVQGIRSDTLNGDLYRESLRELANEIRCSQLVSTASELVPKRWLAAWFVAYRMRPPREALPRPTYLFFAFVVYLSSAVRHLREWRRR